jgi:hypothetical protein
LAKLLEKNQKSNDEYFKDADRLRTSNDNTIDNTIMQKEAESKIHIDNETK